MYPTGAEIPGDLRALQTRDELLLLREVRAQPCVVRSAAALRQVGRRKFDGRLHRRPRRPAPQQRPPRRNDRRAHRHRLWRALRSREAVVGLFHLGCLRY